MDHRPHSPDWPIVEEETAEVPAKSLSSPKGVSRSKRICKPQISRKRVKIHELPALVSPTSKKQRARDMVKKIKKKQKQVSDPLYEVVLEVEFEESDQSPTQYHDMAFSSQRGSLV
ncbi:unnamed protein product [Lactuca virosa]|uniref:Uncharacterized protein n=1 Tax=Lactuca virosa TaxID=75947 RepID=A0AAU9LJE0_9ASTR|nr:unnamed protein product [Lactuca virosa]